MTEKQKAICDLNHLMHLTHKCQTMLETGRNAEVFRVVEGEIVPVIQTLSDNIRRMYFVSGTGKAP